MGHSPWSCKELDTTEQECPSGTGIIGIPVLIPFPNEESRNGYQSCDAARLTGAMGRGGTTEEITYPLWVCGWGGHETLLCQGTGCESKRPYLKCKNNQPCHVTTAMYEKPLEVH